MAVAFEIARRMALALDRAEEVSSYGTPGFKVGGVLFARLHQNLEALVVRIDFEQCAALMEADPETYFITDHYLNYEWILVRLDCVDPDALRDLLQGPGERLGRTRRNRSELRCDGLRGGEKELTLRG